MTSTRNFQSDRADKFIIRFDNEGMRDAIKARALINRRSMNSEILRLIEAGMAKENAPEAATSDALVQ